MIRTAPDDLPDELRTVVDYRKSGLSLNHVVGCPLDCGYCVRHLFDNFDMKRPHRILETKDAVDALINHWAFQRDVTPIQIFNRATDPFLPNVKDELFKTLEMLDGLELTNTVLVITRWRVERADIERLEALHHLRLTILVTWSGIDDKQLEPVDSAIAIKSLEALHTFASRTKSVLYWRPLIVGVNDHSSLMLHAALTDYAAIYERIYGAKERIEILAPFMLDGFLNGDVAFKRARKQLHQTQKED